MYQTVTTEGQFYAEFIRDVVCISVTLSGLIGDVFTCFILLRICQSKFPNNTTVVLHCSVTAADFISTASREIQWFAF